MLNKQQNQLPENLLKINQTQNEETSLDKSFKQSFNKILSYLQRVIMPNKQTEQIDLQILIDILQQGIDEDKKLLEIFIIQQIKTSKGVLVDREVLVNLMLQKIKQIDIKLNDNLKKWWNTFSNLGTGAGTRSFQIRTLLKYINNLEQGKTLSKRMESVFKYKNILTYQQLSAALQQSG